MIAMSREADDPAPPAPAMADAREGQLKVGAQLNQIYEIRRFIARGGMGEVYEGVNVNTDERVAIKVIPAPSGRRPGGQDHLPEGGADPHAPQPPGAGAVPPGHARADVGRVLHRHRVRRRRRPRHPDRPDDPHRAPAARPDPPPGRGPGRGRTTWAPSTATSRRTTSWPCAAQTSTSPRSSTSASPPRTCAPRWSRWSATPSPASWATSPPNSWATLTAASARGPTSTAWAW